jgi:hypothetical protein
MACGICDVDVRATSSGVSKPTPRPTAIEWSSVSVDADAARDPNLTGEARPLDWIEGPHEGVVKLTN